MPSVPGETVLTTLFADVHYYFTEPGQRPSHERFARGSYLYLYHNPHTRQSRLEIANHAGTPNQDAFAGDLDVACAHATYSYKQPNLCTLNVAHASPQDQSQWHISSYDERNEQKRMCKIHTLDLYLFTESDAATFIRHLSTLLHSDSMDIKDAPVAKQGPRPEHRDSMSPVVQRLEQTAISTPRAESVVSTQSSIPGPPTPVSPPLPAAPAAYNPAAPTAPEPIAHREKTPPPPDAEAGTGLKSQGPAHNPNQGFMPQSYFSGPPQQQFQPSYQGFHSSNIPGSQNVTGLPPPPPPGGPSQTNSFPGPPAGHPISPPPHQQQFPSFGPTAPATPGFHQGMSPTYGLQTPLQSPGLPPPPPIQQQQQAQPQQQQHAPVVHGYSDYTYTSNANSNAYTTTGTTGAYNGDVHSQVYRPAAAEAAHSHGSYHGPTHGQQKLEGQSAGRQRLESKGREVEKKVGGVLKWLDKKL